MPFHMLVTEATLCHGGTHELAKILNRIGAAASLTNQRLATQVVQSRRVRGILPEIEKRALSIVSVDNIDILQPHSFVSCTDATRSWHGTSVQCVQPLPITGILQKEDLAKITEPTYSRKHPASSPTASPILVEKSKRRRRILTELPSPHSTLSMPQVCRMPSMYAFDSDAYITPIRSIDIKAFRPSLNEKTNMDIFQDDLLKCLLLKDASQNLPSLQALINCVRKQTSSTEESKVVYVEISSERADSRPTLISMLGKMYKTFVVQQNQKWLLVVGDAIL